MATEVKVINPTNAPTTKTTAIPFIRSATESVAEKKKEDTFNNGKDYQDEGLLFTGEQKSPVRPFGVWTPGIVNAMTVADVAALSRIDETSQTQVRFLEKAVVMDVDAKLIISSMDQMKRGVFRESHYPTMKDYLKSPYYRRLREAQIMTSQIVGIGKASKLKESGVADIRLNPQLVRVHNAVDKSIGEQLKKTGFAKEMKQLRESMGTRLREDFAEPGQSMPNWDGGMSYAVGGREPDFAPLIAGPFNKQLYWFDYLDMHSKAFEAATHNPIAKRIIKVITQFVLGKGVKLTVERAIRASDEEKAQQDTQQLAQHITGKQPPINIPDYKPKCQVILNRHWTRNSLHILSKRILKDLITFGEQFIRYFDAPWGLRIIPLDPSTVWEVVTDPDDCEHEFYLHQQYPTRYQWYVDLPIPTIKFIIRQVPSLHYYHMKINSTSGEVRGRSELFAILGWLKRLKEWASDRVVRNKMANLFILDVAVEGDAGAVQAIQQQFLTPPVTGSFFVHNKAAELKGVSVELGASDAAQDWEVFLTIAGMGAGISMEYLGAAPKGSKAQALVGTEPDIKSFEDYQELMEQFFLQDAQRVFDRAKERGEIPRDLLITVEATFPTLAEENRSEKLKDFAFGESMSWFSHQRIASAAAKEMQFTSYDYNEEQKQIAYEDAMKEFLINTAYQQVTKGVDNSRSAVGMGRGMGGGGTSSGSSGQGASGMGMGKLPGAGGSSGSKQSGESEARAQSIIDGAHPAREAEDEDYEHDEGLSTTSPGTSTASAVSHTAVPQNASTGDKRIPWEGADVREDGRKDRYRGRDPRDVASSIKREAANLRYERRDVGRREDRVQTPGKVRDQKNMDRSDILGKARQALNSGNLNKEAKFPKLLNPSIREARADAINKVIRRFPRTEEGRRKREAMEPFKPQDGDQLQRPRVHPVEDHNGKMKPRGYGASKR